MNVLALLLGTILSMCQFLECVCLLFCLSTFFIDCSMLWYEQSKLRWNGMEVLVLTNNKSGQLLCEEL